MGENRLDRSDIIEVLGGCRIVAKEIRGNWRYRAEGGLLDDGRRIAVVVELEVEEEGADILVITVWELR
jgi:hypothetical protein